MDPDTIREAFQHYVLVGCGIGLLTMAVGGIVYGLSQMPNRIRKNARKYGWGAVVFFFGAAAWATVNAYPTREEKAQYEQERRRPNTSEQGIVTSEEVDGDEGQTGLTGLTGLEGADNHVNPVNPVDESLLSIRLPTAQDYAAGFALTGIGTGETFDFAPPEGARVYVPWLLRGAAVDWHYVKFGTESSECGDADGQWRFRFGTNEIDRLTVFSYGTARPRMKDRATFFSPFETSLGIVPESNWHLLPTNSLLFTLSSQFWSCLTPSNTFVMTWQNVLLDRLSDRPVSFQMEFEESGGLTFRYDLSRLAADVVTNLVVGVSNGGIGRTFTKLDRSTTSLRWSRLTFDDLVNPDRDGDGVPTVDELLVHHTNPDLADTDGDGLPDGSDPEPLLPTSLADLDGNGLPDAYEDHWFGVSNHLDLASVTNRDETGFTPGTKFLAGVDPTNAASTAVFVSTNSLVSWRLFDGLAADWPADAATNLVWERTFAVGRSSAWQQYFLSASPSNAAPWSLSGMRLEWETDTGSSGTAASSPFNDSLRIPLAADDMLAILTLRLRADGPATVRSATPLHLVAYAPEFRLEGGTRVTGDSGRTYTVFTEGSDSSIDLVIDAARRPHRAPAGASARDMEPFEDLSMQSGGCSFAGDETGGTVRAPRPGISDVPDPSLSLRGPSPARAPRRAPRSGGGSLIVFDPSVGWGCSWYGCDSDGLGYDWEGDWYCEEDYYPLDSKCLRRKWYRDWGGGWYTGACELSVSSGVGEGRGGPVSTSVDGNVGSVYVDGVKVWSGTAEHVHSGDGCGDYREDVLADGCDSCDTDCANGNCAGLEGTTLGSLKFRIPLGAPVKGQVAGFVWFATEGPISVSKSTFELLAHPDAHVTDSLSGSVRQIRCTDSRGRDLDLENIPDGVRITIREHATQTLEHTWEIVNVGGSDSMVRLRKISRQNNVMSDETYTCSDGDWTLFDNVAGVGTHLEISYGPFDDERVLKSETRTTTDGEGRVLSAVTTEWSRVGECDNAVVRETRRVERTGLNERWSQADYWNDPAHAGRHGRPRLVWGNDRSWTYTDYDGRGHATLRVEQRGDASVPADFPYVVSNGLFNAACLANAFVTMNDYTPLDGDAAHADDAAKPRVETRYLVRNGTATLVGRTWHRYTRLVRGGYDAIRHETWRAASQDAAFGDASNAYSHEIVYADTGAGTPLLMRGASAESLDEDGILTVNVHSLPSTNVLSCATRRRGPDGTTPFPTYEVVERDAQYGTVLRRTMRLAADDTVVADEQSLYDSQNRLRSTTYLDGTSLTNAYSCCRLLWSVDREGRRTRRSALTGSDHLYNAIEDEWLADVSTNGMFRVTQHFFDALGRETNTVVYAGSTPGEATNSLASAGKALSSETTVYPDGDSDYAVHTDARGKVTVSRTDVLGDCVERGEAVFTNGVEVVRTKSRSYFGGGSSIRREWGSGVLTASTSWTEERSFDDYLADGRRVAYVLTDSSDCGTVTNSVTTYDPLGRAVSVETPLGVTSNVYDGATSRLLSSVYTAGPVRRETLYLYDDLGEQVGIVRDGVTNRADVAYELFSNQWWRVTREATVGPGTNAWSVSRERLTGLSDGMRSQVIRETSAGDREERIVTFDAATGLQTESVSSARNGISTQRSCKGLVLSEQNTSGSVTNSYDALGRVVCTEKSKGNSDVFEESRESIYNGVGDVIAVHTRTATNEIVETYSHDAFGRRTSVVNALGETIETAYDAVGNVVSVSGATYPVRYEYDSQGRRTALLMTENGVDWIRTRWTYDAATGLCTSKIYADGSVVTYTYTPDGLLETTTYSRGRWITNLYDARRQLVGTTSSDGTQNTTYVRDAYGRTIGESNAVVRTTLDLNNEGVATGESRTDGSNTVFLGRTVDGLNRLSGLFVPSLGYSENFAYTEDNLISTISNEDAVVTYTYSRDRRDAGYVISFADGGRFTRTVARDPYRRDVVTAVTNACGASVLGLAYAHDDLSRPIARNDDVFAYNGRGEVSFAEIAGNVETHAYDLSGNSLWASFNAVTNHYTANNLNQYSSISTLCAYAPLRETIPHYDADGNLVSFGAWSYTYDAASQLVSVSSNGVLLVTNQYDCRRRCVKKITPNAMHTFLYDDWNLIRERVDYTNGTTEEFDFYWGRDLSGTLQGAGGVGGLLYVKRNGVIYVPYADANGNILRYTDTAGNIVAEYTYDAFGRAISQSGSLADVFRHRFSSKYFDVETELYYYGYRFYHSVLMRWLNRDPLAEHGGINLYAFCHNNAYACFDKDGCAYFVKRRLENMPWLGEFSRSLSMDILNIEVSHEHLFFEDGLTPSNLGLHSDGKVAPDTPHNNYIVTSGHYNDCVMRKAVDMVGYKHEYSLLGLWGKEKFNCQDWAADVRSFYYSLYTDKKVRCECNIRD